MLPPRHLFAEGVEPLVAGSMGQLAIVFQKGGEVIGARVEEAGDSEHAVLDWDGGAEGGAGFEVANDWGWAVLGGDGG